MSNNMHQIFYCNLLLFKWQCHIKKRNIYFAVQIHLSRKAIIKCSQTSKLHNFVARSQICWKLLKPRSLKTRVNSYSKNSAIEFQNIFCINSTLDQKWPYQKKVCECQEQSDSLKDNFTATCSKLGKTYF